MNTSSEWPKSPKLKLSIKHNKMPLLSKLVIFFKKYKKNLQEKAGLIQDDLSFRLLCL